MHQFKKNNLKNITYHNAKQALKTNLKNKHKLLNYNTNSVGNFY